MQHHHLNTLHAVAAGCQNQTNPTSMLHYYITCLAHCSEKNLDDMQSLLLLDANSTYEATTRGTTATHDVQTFSERPWLSSVISHATCHPINGWQAAVSNTHLGTKTLNPEVHEQAIHLGGPRPFLKDRR